MSRRLISGAVLHVAAVLLLLAPGLIWFPLALAASLRLNVELAGLWRGNGHRDIWPLSGIGSALLIAATAAAALWQPAGTAWSAIHPIVITVQAAVIALVLIGSVMIRLRATTPPATATDLALLWFAILYVGWLPGFFPLIRMLPDGAWRLAWIVGGAVLSDNAALLFGKLFGRRPFFAHLSPGKTRAGAIGSLIVTPVVLTVTGFLAAIPLRHAAVLGCLIAVAAQAGDLAESLLKRDAGAKDSADLIPGHGGLLDRLDSCLFVGVLGYFYLTTVMPLW
jgi:CDP-diglyceride synthetase